MTFLKNKKRVRIGSGQRSDSCNMSPPGVQQLSSSVYSYSEPSYHSAARYTKLQNHHGLSGAATPSERTDLRIKPGSGAARQTMAEGAGAQLSRNKRAR